MNILGLFPWRIPGAFVVSVRLGWRDRVGIFASKHAAALYYSIAMRA